jgi:enolase
LLVIAVGNCKYTGLVKFAIDPAASEFFESERYNFALKKGPSAQPLKGTLAAPDMSYLYTELVKKYPIVLLEDPFAQDEWDAWSKFNQTCKIELVWDDLLETNLERIKIANEKKACNSLLLKINQIGTITEAIDAYV